jgi:hypothetical protein
VISQVLAGVKIYTSVFFLWYHVFLWQMVISISEEFAGGNGNSKVLTKLTLFKITKAYGGLGL